MHYENTTKIQWKKKFAIIEMKCNFHEFFLSKFFVIQNSIAKFSELLFFTLYSTVEQLDSIKLNFKW